MYTPGSKICSSPCSSFELLLLPFAYFRATREIIGLYPGTGTPTYTVSDCSSVFIKICEVAGRRTCRKNAEGRGGQGHRGRGSMLDGLPSLVASHHE